MNKPQAILVWLFFLLILCFDSVAQQYDKIWALGSSASTMTFEGDSIVLGQLWCTPLLGQVVDKAKIGYWIYLAFNISYKKLLL